MSDVLPPIEPETSGQVTQLDSGHSGDAVFQVAVVVVIGLIVSGFCWWLFKIRKGDSKTKFRLFFKKEWIWRLFLVLQIAGLIGIAYLAVANDDNWHLIPYTRWTGQTACDFFDSQFWTQFHENWLLVVFFIGPFLISKAMDWVIASKKKSAPADNWKNN